MDEQVKAGVTITTVEKAFDDGSAAVMQSTNKALDPNKDPSKNPNKDSKESPGGAELGLLDSRLTQLQQKVDAALSSPPIDLGAQLAELKRQIVSDMAVLLSEAVGRPTA